MNDLNSLLPPIVLSIGGVLPFLIKGAPFNFGENNKSVAISCMILITWTAYLLSMIVSRTLFFSNLLTILTVAAASIIFLVLVILLSFKRKNMAEWAFISFVLGLFLTAFGSANYIAGSGNVVLILKLTQEDSRKIKKVHWIAKATNSNEPVPLFLGAGNRYVLSLGQADSTDIILVGFDGGDTSKIKRGALVETGRAGLAREWTAAIPHN